VILCAGARQFMGRAAENPAAESGCCESGCWLRAGCESGCCGQILPRWDRPRALGVGSWIGYRAGIYYQGVGLPDSVTVGKAVAAAAAAAAAAARFSRRQR
jgi:hypothetical protein